MYNDIKISGISVYKSMVILVKDNNHDENNFLYTTQYSKKGSIPASMYLSVNVSRDYWPHTQV